MLRPSWLFCLPRLPVVLVSIRSRFRLQRLPASSKAKRRQASAHRHYQKARPQAWLLYRYTHVYTNKWLSDVLNFKKQGNHTEQNKWATLYTKIYGQIFGSSFWLIYQTLRNAKLNAKLRRQIIPQIRYHRREQRHPQCQPAMTTAKVSVNQVQTRRKPGRLNRKDK